jgi:hypothetical protein
MCSPISFHPLSVIFETPAHGALLEKVGVRQLVSDVFDELLGLAQAQDCTFSPDFKQKIIGEMVRSSEATSIMYQDFTAGRPMEVETYLGSPIKLAQTVGMKVPRIETLYAILHNLNIANQQRKAAGVQSPTAGGHPVRLSSAPPPRQMMGPAMNGRGRGRTSSMNGPPPGMRRGPPPMNGGPPNGYPPNGYGRSSGNGYPPRNQSRRGSIEGDTLGEDFSHIALYDDLTIPEGGESNYGDQPDIALRERELMLRQRELALREQELRMRNGGPRGPGPRRAPPTPSVRNGGFDDEDDDDDYFDPADGPPLPLIDPDNFDMMSVTSRRNRKGLSASQIRKNPETNDNFQSRRNGGGGGGQVRPGYPRNRSSARIISQVPGLHDSLMDDPLMGYSSNRYANVDRKEMGQESRTNSLTTARLEELQYGGATPNSQSGPYPRRASQSPGNPYSPQMGRVNGRPSPPNGYGPPVNGVNGRPSPPGGMRQPVPRHPPGQGNAVAPQQVEQYAGVSALLPPKGPLNVRSLTGSASASAGSGDSANIDSEPSAHSSQSSLGPRPPVGVR